MDLRIKYYSPGTEKKSRSSRVPDETWTSYQALIEDWYIVRNKTLEEVMEELGKRGFFPSKRQMTSQLKKWGLRKTTSRLEHTPAPAYTMREVGSQFLDPSFFEDVGTEPQEIHGTGHQFPDNSSPGLLQGVELSEEEWNAPNIDLDSPLSISMLSLRDHVAEQFNRLRHRNLEFPTAYRVHLQQHVESTRAPAHNDSIGDNLHFEASISSSNVYDDETIGRWSHSMLDQAYDSIEDGEFRIPPSSSSPPREIGIDEDVWDMIQTPEYEFLESECSQGSLNGQELDSL